MATFTEKKKYVMFKGDQIITQDHIERLHEDKRRARSHDTVHFCLDQIEALAQRNADIQDELEELGDIEVADEELELIKKMINTTLEDYRSEYQHLTAELDLAEQEVQLFCKNPGVIEVLSHSKALERVVELDGQIRNLEVKKAEVMAYEESRKEVI